MAGGAVVCKHLVRAIHPASCVQGAHADLRLQGSKAVTRRPECAEESQEEGQAHSGACQQL